MMSKRLLGPCRAKDKFAWDDGTGFVSSIPSGRSSSSYSHWGKHEDGLSEPNGILEDPLCVQAATFMAYWFFSGRTEEDKEVLSYYVTNPAGKYKEFNSATVETSSVTGWNDVQCSAPNPSVCELDGEHAVHQMEAFCHSANTSCMRVPC